MLKIVYKIPNPGSWNPVYIKIKPAYINSKACLRELVLNYKYV